MAATANGDGVVVDRAPGSVQVRHNVHDGRGATLMRLIASVERSPFALLDWTLPPGSSEGPHTHGQDAVGLEQYYVVTGTVVLQVGAQTWQLTEGDSVGVPRTLLRSVRNDSARHARLLLVYERL